MPRSEEREREVLHLDEQEQEQEREVLHLDEQEQEQEQEVQSLDDWERQQWAGVVCPWRARENSRWTAPTTCSQTTIRVPGRHRERPNPQSQVHTSRFDLAGAKPTSQAAGSTCLSREPKALARRGPDARLMRAARHRVADVSDCERGELPTWGFQVREVTQR